MDNVFERYVNFEFYKQEKKAEKVKVRLRDM